MNLEEKSVDATTPEVRASVNMPKLKAVEFEMSVVSMKGHEALSL